MFSITTIIVSSGRSCSGSGSSSSSISIHNNDKGNHGVGALVADKFQVGSTQMGPLQNKLNLKAWGRKVHPGTFGKIASRIASRCTRVPNKVPLSNKLTLAVTPLVQRPH